MEHVNHPKHYNQHPAGIECIDGITFVFTTVKIEERPNKED